MPKLVLKVSPNVPELPAAVRKEKNLAIKRVKTLTRDQVRSGPGDDIVAWFLDPAFVAAHARAMESSCFTVGSVLLWNPKGASLFADSVPAELVFDEITSFKNPEAFLRTVRNVFRRLRLERELELKERLLEDQKTENSELLKVGIALSSEKDNNKLLDYILKQVRHITRADAGTLYLLKVDEATKEQKLLFKITQNDSNPRDYSEFFMPLSKQTVSGYVAITGKVLNIPDAYRIAADKEYGFNISYDKSTGYRSKSMLTVPMQDHKGEILGVIQLINCKVEENILIRTPEDADTCVIPFSEALVPTVLSLASQAAVSLENNNLYDEIETLFEGFVNASVRAIESRDPATRGHSRRVAVYTESLARALERAGVGAYAGLRFSPENLKEIRYASLLHDFGKVGVREHVLIKAKKLYPAQLENLQLRYAYIRKAVLYSKMRERFEALVAGREQYDPRSSTIDKEEAEELATIERFLQGILTANEPHVLAEAPAQILKEIKEKTFEEQGEAPVPFLTGDEYEKLSIPKGSLDDKERDEINSHVTHTWEFLKTIPWTKEMKNIPIIAYGHHEKLNGLGYPRGVQSTEIPVQTRMMTVSDIYDALTASDRPYKPAISPERALDILGAEVKEEKLDPDLVKVFIEAKIWAIKADDAR